MPDLVILYDVPGWAYESRARALAHHAPADFRVRLAAFNRFAGGPREAQVEALDLALGEAAPDLILVMCHHELAFIRRRVTERGWPTLLAACWNNGWPRHQRAFYALFADADVVILNNRDYWEKAGRPGRCRVITNGVDLDTFRVTRPLDTRTPRVLWCGSEYHREVKGYDAFVAPLFERLREEGVACEVLLTDSRATTKRTHPEMAEWYNTGTVLLCASAAEGTPNTALEAAACGCTLVSTRVGNMPELIRDGENGFLTDRDPGALLRGLRRALRDYGRLAPAMANAIQGWGWLGRAAEYFDCFRALLDGGAPAHFPGPLALADPRPDLSEEVTVFVSSVGAASLDACLEHLRRQDCRFRLERIDGVFPMSAAFQLMLDRCETPYYVQVDEDMLLHPQAIRLLYERIRCANPEVALTAAWLWDAHLGRCIIGVKAYRHAIVRRYPYSHAESCEKDQIARMAHDGFRYLPPPDDNLRPDGPFTFGLHGTHYGPRDAFERYATLEHRRRLHPDRLAWFAGHHHALLQRFLEDPTEVNLAALLGTLAGAILPPRRRGEKDFTRYDRLPGLAEARAFYAACQAATLSPADEAPQ